jgi:hypothetical protein
MPRPKKNPNAVLFAFVANPEKEIAKSTLANYKVALNKLAQKSSDEKKTLIQTKEDLLKHTDVVLELLKDEDRFVKGTTMAAIFHIIGRQEETHPYVTAFRQNYYTPTYVKKLTDEGKLIPDIPQNTK